MSVSGHPRQHADQDEGGFDATMQPSWVFHSLWYACEAVGRAEGTLWPGPVLIVWRTQPAICTSLGHVFGGTIDVIFDRRVGERRQRPEPAGARAEKTGALTTSSRISRRRAGSWSGTPRRSVRGHDSSFCRGASGCGEVERRTTERCAGPVDLFYETSCMRVLGRGGASRYGRRLGAATVSES